MIMKKLNIFIDETGDFGINTNSSKLYGISFVFHNQDDDISMEIKNLNERLSQIGYDDMIHMADLVMKRGDYQKYDIVIRKKIFKAIYHFSRKIPVKYHTLIVDKRYVNSEKTLKQRLYSEIEKMINSNKKFFEKYDDVVMYYDNGQELLGDILDSIFIKFEKFHHIDDFDHKKQRLFQVADMLTFIDKYNYKYQNKITFTKGEKYFFESVEMRKIISELKKKRL